MLVERQIISVILDENLSNSADLNLRLAGLGFVHSNGLPFSQAQINSFLHSARQEERKRNRHYVESCGIDRSKNPCGDASDY